MDFFRPAPATPAAANTNANPNANKPGQIPDAAATASATAATGGTAPNGTIPAAANADDNKSPLDAFTDLWKTDPNAAANVNEPYFKVDMESLQKAAANQNFATAITPEQIAAISKGGEEAVKAFADAINSATREVYARSAFATTKIVENALAKAETKIGNKVPDLIKQYTVSDSLRTENPALSHPAAQPIINALEAVVLQKHPNATAAEQRAMALDYLTAFSAAVSPTKPDAAAVKKAAQETDWSTFLQ